MADITTLLRKSEIFVGLPDAKLEQILTIGRERVCNADETIISEGEPSDEMYVVQEGMVEVLVASGPVPDVPSSAKMMAVVQLGRGQVFGEMALVDRGARSATVRSVVDGTRLFIIPREAFWELCDNDCHIGYVVMRNIARDLSFKLRHRNLPRVVGR